MKEKRNENAKVDAKVQNLEDAQLEQITGGTGTVQLVVDSNRNTQATVTTTTATEPTASRVLYAVPHHGPR